MTRDAGDAAVFVLRPALTPDRTWLVRDGMVFNWFALNAPLMIVLQLMTALPGYPDGNIVAAVLVAGLFCLALTLVYACLGSSFPRNGGDYLFQRRLLSTRWGAIFGFTGIVVGGALAAAFAGWMATQMVAAPALVLLGRAYDRPGLIDAAWALQSRTMALSAAVLLLGAALVLNLLGMKIYARVQRWMFLLGLSAVACTVVALALMPPRLDESAFSVVAGVAGGLPYPPREASPVTATVLLMPCMATALLPVTWNVAQSGEIRGAGILRNQVRMLIPVQVAVIGFASLFSALVLARYGRQDLAAAGALFLRAPGELPLPCPPLYWIEPGWSTLGPCALLVCSAIGLVMWVAGLALTGSRLVQVVGAERLLPRWLASGSARRVPRSALVAFLLLATATAFGFWLAGDWLLAVDAAQMVLFSTLVTALAAALFPFLRREDYRESTAAPLELFGVPVITVAGSLFGAFSVFASWSLLFDDRLLLGGRPLASRLLLIGIYACTLATFTAHGWFRRRRPERRVELLCEALAPKGGRR